MPRLPTIGSGALSELEAQQRFASRAALIRQIERAEALASEIEPGTNYPEDWIVYRITGYRPDLDDPAILVGAALVRDMSALVERLCERAKMTTGDARGGFLTREQLCEKWGVTRKTIERYRKRGLVGRRLRREDGRVILGFMPQAVASFESENAELLGYAQQFERMDDATRAKIVRRARRYHRLGFTLTQAAGRIALKLGRSREGVRQALLRHDAEAADPVFGQRAALDDAARERIVAAFRMGAPPRALVAQFDRSRATIHRVVNEARAVTLRQCVPRPSEAAAQAALDPAGDSVLTHPAVALGLGEPVELEASAYLEWARGLGAPGAQTERARAASRARLVARAGALAHGEAPSAEALDRAETDLRWASLLTVELVRTLGGLIVRAIEERTERPLLELPADDVATLLDTAHAAATRAVDRYHPERGGRLAGAANIELSRALAGVMAHAPSPGKAKRLHEGAIGLRDWTSGPDPWSGAVRPERGLREALALVDEDEARVIALRFGWSGAAPMTLEELHGAVGITPGRFAAMLRRALGRVGEVSAGG